MKARGDIERRRARRHLHMLLDEMCADLGLDPEEAWRGPSREAERERLLAPLQRLGEAVRKAFGVTHPPQQMEAPPPPPPRRIHLSLPGSVKPGDTIEITIPTITVPD